MLTPDDIGPGTLLTILRGNRCPCGLCSEERYGNLKGIPLAVIGINLPYLATAICGGAGSAIIDVRECELTAVTPAYAEAVKLAIGGPECGGK